MREFLRILPIVMLLSMMFGTGQAMGQANEPMATVTIAQTGAEQVRLGQPITYTLTVKNSGNATVPNIVVRAVVPPGLKFKDRSQGASLRWDLGALDPKQERTLTYAVETTKAGSFENLALVYAKERLLHKAECPTKVVAPNLEITQEDQRIGYLYKTLSFKIKITNYGDACAKNVVIVDTLSHNLDYVKSSPRGVFKRSIGDRLATVTWRFAEVPANSIFEIELEARVNQTGRGINSVRLISQAPEPPQLPVLEDSDWFELCAYATMSASIHDTEDPVEVGKTMTYIVRFVSVGSYACTRMEVTCRIPEEMEVIEADGKGPTGILNFKHESRGIVFDVVPYFHPGEELLIHIVCKAIKPGSAYFTAIGTHTEFCDGVGDYEGTSVYK